MGTVTDNDEPTPRLFVCRIAGPQGFARPLSIRERVREHGYPWQRRLNRLRRMQQLRRWKRTNGPVLLWDFSSVTYNVSAL